VRVPGLLLRFVVEFWGPLSALVMIRLQVGAVTDLLEAKHRWMGMMGASPMPLLDRTVNALLRIMLVPNLVVAVPWLAGFLFALVDRDRQTLHDRAARTRVIYEVRDLGETGEGETGLSYRPGDAAPGPGHS
jgi:hypothetical protein